jgi:DNA mismatch endonuclease, patch repair protein
MSAVRSRDTGPELALRKALYAEGIRGWRCNYRRAPGRPDIAWPARKVAVFVDGAFWHGHPSRHKPGRSGKYWDRKIAQNIARDRRVDAELAKSGWAVLRVWDFEIRDDLSSVVARVIDVLEKRPAKPSSVASPANWWQSLSVGRAERHRPAVKS